MQLAHKLVASPFPNHVPFSPRCPESAKIKQKMLYSSSYDALKKALVGVYKYVQACDYEEASQEEIEKAFQKGGK